MQSISARVGPNIPVILVGTHADSKEFKNNENLLVQKLEQAAEEYSRFKNIKMIIPVSCSEGIGIEELKQSIINIALEQKYMGEKLPSTYVSLEEAVQKCKEEKANRSQPPILDWNEFKVLAQKCHINNEESLKVATKFLHDLGVLLYYPSNRNEGDLDLNNLVIVDPQWLIDMMVCPSFFISLSPLFSLSIS